jgi:gamma-glutamyltranspeptidase/glutathione hydrolase
MLQALGMLASFDLDRLAAPERAHVVIEAMRRAYRDRAVFMGDPDFIPADTVPKLLDPQHLNKMRSSIDLDHATPSKDLAPSWLAPKPQGTNTTHFSILDTAGNRVAATLSINTLFGAAFIPDGTGVLLNNEMDDFAVAAGAPNIYGLVGDDANAIAPGKRPLSSMTPTFVETKDTVAILGTPGGSRIISMVLLATLDVVHGRGRVADWVAQPRFHHQFLPDRVQYEPGAFSEEVAAALIRKGHTLYEVKSGYGNMQAVSWDKAHGRVEAASDPRGEGEAVVVPVGADSAKGKRVETR